MKNRGLYVAARNKITEQMLHILDFVTKSSTTAIIAGDLNFDLFCINSDSNVDAFFNLLSSYSFLPSITLPTRQGENTLSLLDNIYCNNVAYATSSGVVYDDFSDHFPIYMSYKTNEPRVARLRETFNYKHDII